ncbi:hypothetical protein SAMN05444000_10237 [Shimia gijangensis]|uniref:Uncharacterized protein n=1 Tax=Shimia gijangensis TaxID=1470563 RepID=A0A1M6CDL1_9RHOB|nr:hypothetical protein SAMN05444000_10237 [Shimia gijangensis]
MQAENPDVVIIATGGLPDIDWISGAEHCTTSWDFLTGAAPTKESILVYDGTGRNPAMSCAERAAVAGAQVSLVALDGSFGPEMTYSEQVTWKQRLYDLDIPASFDLLLKSVQESGDKLQVTFANEVTGKQVTKTVDQVVIERGTLPADDLYQELRAASANDGVTDIECLLAGKAQPGSETSNAAFQLHRIGDAVSSRNIYSAILDAARLSNSI